MKNLLLIFFVFSLFCANCQPYVHTTGSVTTCSGLFYDNGNTGNYLNNSNVTQTFVPPSSCSALSVTFSAFNVEAGYDFLYVYNGNSTSAPLIGTYTGTTLPSTIVSSSTDGSLTFRFTSDNTQRRAGWVASFSCITKLTLNAGVDKTVSCHGNTTMSATATTLGFTGSTTYQQNLMPVGSYVTDASNTEVGVTLSGAPVGATITSVTFTPQSYVTPCTFPCGFTLCYQYNSWVRMEYWNGSSWIVITTCNSPVTISNFNGNAVNGQNIKIRTINIDAFSDYVYTDLSNVTATYQYNPTITYSWSPNTVNGYTTLSSVTILNPTVTPANTTLYTLTATSNGCSASDAVLITMPCALPVELTNFSAHCQSGISFIKWETASESNSDYFLVENSRDGESWTVVNSVGGAGNSNSPNSYETVDYSFRGETSYYRLRQVDFDGNFEVFEPVSVSCEEEEDRISIHPNPNTGKFFLEIYSEKDKGMQDVNLIDNTGRLVKTRKIDINNGTTVVNFTIDLPSGVYLLSVSGMNQKFIIE